MGSGWASAKMEAVSLEIEEQGRKIRFWFSGDIGRYKLPAR